MASVGSSGSRYPLVAASGPRLAADMVAAVNERGRVRLDYSARSLAVVDRVIEGIRRAGAARVSVAEALLGFGAYAGEVLVREAQAEWVDFDGPQREVFEQTFGVRTPDGRVWNPVGKAFKRYDNGAEDSLYMFYLAVVGQARI